MPRTTSKAESVNASEKVYSASGSFPSSLLSAWPMADATSSMPRLVDGARRISELQVEFAQFGVQQARKNVATLAAFSTCRTPMDILEIWRTVATDAVSDYAEKAERILERVQQ